MTHWFEDVHSPRSTQKVDEPYICEKVCFVIASQEE